MLTRNFMSAFRNCPLILPCYSQCIIFLLVNPRHLQGTGPGLGRAGQVYLCESYAVYLLHILANTL